MAIPNITKDNVVSAFEFIDENSVPLHNQSTKYDVLSESGKKYPPKYVVAVADHIANGSEINTDGYTAIEAKNFLEGLGFTVETKDQEEFKLIIKADSVESNDERFTMDDLGSGNHYVPLDTFFVNAAGKTIKRNYEKYERHNCGQTMPRIAFQIYESNIIALTPEEKEQFPVCQYYHDSELICGIFPSVDAFKKYKNTIEYLKYRYGEGRAFVIYCWNLFSTIIFVQECLKRFGSEGDKFVLIYREKLAKEAEIEEKADGEKEVPKGESQGPRNSYSPIILESKNVIFRGAPGTGKSYLAKQIAADIISNGYISEYSLLSDEQKKQVEFVQFHPSYDYSDFVEGLRPKINADGSMGFELKDGIFKVFVERARKNYENSQKSKDALEKELSANEALADFFSSIELSVDKFTTVNGTEFTITDVDDNHIYISIPGNAASNTLNLNIDEVRRMLESDVQFNKIKDVTTFFGKTFATQGYSYDFVIYNEIRKRIKTGKTAVTKAEEPKKYLFIIDEINRGEISKILGELFFAIDPGYRGRSGEISTQYSNLHSNPDDKFYIPENVYIIGTMNDIDRSVDSFDFAMRRRFRFIELKADDRLEMLSELGNESLEEEAAIRMANLNKEIADIEDLNENYQIGAAYFLKLKTIGFDKLWTDYLCPLLKEYIQGMYDEDGIMKRLEKAYGYKKTSQDELNDTDQS